ncbi:MAG: flippase [archaeon]
MPEEQDAVLKTVVKGAGIIFLGVLLAYVANFFYKLVLSRYLGPSQYGVISLAEMFMYVGMMIAVFGMHEGLVHFVAFFRGKKQLAEVKGTLFAALKITIPIGVAICVLIILSSNYIANTLFHTPELQPILIIFAIIIPIHVILRVLGSFFLALKKPGYTELAKTVFKNISNLVLVIGVVLAGGTLLHISIVYLVSVIIASLTALWIYKYKVSPKMFKKKTNPTYNYKEFLSFSLPLFFTGIFFQIMGWADTFFLGVFKTSTDVGIYNVAFSLAAGMGMFLASFGGIFYPLCSEMLAKKKGFLIGASFEIVIRWIFMITLPLFLLILFFPRDILKVLFGGEYISGWLALVILSSAYFFNVITGPGIHTLKSYKKTKFIFNLNLIIVIMNIVLNILFIPLYGITGAAIATAVSIIIRELVIFLRVKVMIKFSYNINYYLKYILSAGLSLAVVYFVLVAFFQPYSLIEVIIAFCLFLIGYVFLLLLFRSFGREDFMILLTVEKKSGLNLRFVKKILKRFMKY